MSVISHFVNGSRLRAPLGRAQAVFNPATGQQCASVALADQGVVDRAVAAAKAAWPA